MNCEEYLDMYWSDTLEEELEIRFTFVDYDPSVGLDYEFEWEVLDESGKDRSYDLQQTERWEIERMILKHIKDNHGRAEV
jgi:hypothetical protein